MPTSSNDKIKDIIVVEKIPRLINNLKEVNKILVKSFIYITTFLGIILDMFTVSSIDLAKLNSFSSRWGGAMICIPIGPPSLEILVEIEMLGQRVRDMQPAIINMGTESTCI